MPKTREPTHAAPTTLAKIMATLLVSLVLVVRPAGLFGEKEP